MIEFSYSRQKRLDTGKVVNSVMTRVSVNGVKAMFVMAYDGDFD